MKTWTRAELLRVARERFGVRAFRPGQAELIETVLAGRDALGLLPTGAGKSLTFQLPALLVPGTVLVVSPLIALMQDQKDKLAEHDIPCAALNSTLAASEERAVIADIRAGEPEIVYVTPERLENVRYLDLLKQRGVSLLVVDEAHCVSQWGHDFRPAYLSLRDALHELGRPPVLALTATATRSVIDDITAQLSMRDPRVVSTGVERENLAFAVRRAPRSGQKRELLREILGEESGVGIVYTATIRVAEELHQFLSAAGFEVGLYHGKLKASVREETQRNFMQDRYKVMVATNAFGLGIDKPDLRFVLHYNFPDSVETYYQEAGRAGRDGQPARATLLYRLEDRQLQSYFIGGKYPSRAESHGIVQALCSAEAAQSARGLGLAELAARAESTLKRTKVVVAQLEACGVVERRRGRVVLLRKFHDFEELDGVLGAYEERRADDRDRLDQMMRYAQTGKCRMQFMRSYFDEPEAEPCQRCDNCTAPQQVQPKDKAAGAPRELSDAALERLVASAVGGGVDAAAVAGLEPKRPARSRKARPRAAAATG